jgi:hypothetical protein
MTLTMPTPLRALAEAATSAAFRATPMTDDQAVEATLKAIATLRAAGRTDEADAYAAALPRTPRATAPAPAVQADEDDDQDEVEVDDQGDALVTDPAAKKLRARAERIDPDLRVYAGYSGRGMYGRTSALAFKSDIAPNTHEGRKLTKLGLAVDNLGQGFIYYTRS